MAGQPSITSDYISIISQAIEKAQNDPTHLRGLVYDIARSCLAKHILANYHELGSVKWYRHMLDLEEAINQVESLSQSANKALTDDPSAQLLDGPEPANSRDHDDNALVVQEPVSDATANNVWRDNTPVVLQPTLNCVNEPFPEIIQASDLWVPAFGSVGKRNRIDLPWGLPLAIAAFIGVVIYAVLLVPFSYIQTLNHSTAEQLAQAAPSIPANAQLDPKVSLRESNSAAVAQALGFSPPTVYGVYAVSGGKLFTLGPLPIKVPDPRVGISAMISEPSYVTVPDGKLSFVIYRRDLVSSTPTEAFVRVVAQVERELKFNVAGPPTPEKIKDQWAIRSKSYQFKVSPIDDKPEMVVLHPEDPNLVLSAGRYALSISGHGYDFTVAGQMTDTAQCLERTEAVGGTIYSECRTPAEAEAEAKRKSEEAEQQRVAALSAAEEEAKRTEAEARTRYAALISQGNTELMPTPATTIGPSPITTRRSDSIPKALSPSLVEATLIRRKATTTAPSLITTR